MKPNLAPVLSALALLICGCASQPVHINAATDPELQRFNAQLAERNAAADAAPPTKTQDEEDQERREKFVADNPSLPDDQKEAVLGARAIVGMTPAAVEASWGPADNAKDDVTAVGQTTTWYYSARAGVQHYAIFVNGSLSQISTIR
jgi:hypothetical protein